MGGPHQNSLETESTAAPDGGERYPSDVPGPMEKIPFPAETTAGQRPVLTCNCTARATPNCASRKSSPKIHPSPHILRAITLKPPGHVPGITQKRRARQNSESGLQTFPIRFWKSWTSFFYDFLRSKIFKIKQKMFEGLSQNPVRLISLK